MNCWSKYKKCKIVKQEKNCDDPDTVFSWWSLFIFILAIILFVLVQKNFTTLPYGLLISEASHNPDAFIGENAYNNLAKLTENGPRIAGGFNNDFATVNFLISLVEEIKRNSHFTNKIEVDKQYATSSYLIKAGKFHTTNVYRRLPNVVVRLSPVGTIPENSLLINAHFDSVPTSPGANDDGSMTVVSLEILRVLSRMENKFKHSIIFLFNGCEEHYLQGSHGFITTHKWASSIRAFINLEAAGKAAREIMFQAGPKHPWLMNYYRKSAKRPFASAVAEELFQAGLIPSDSDFRQFRDHGKIPGYDFAYSTGGFLYHTKYDAIDSISVGALQHTGENILELTKNLANADELFNTKAHEDGKVIFFDFLNWFMVYYTETTGIVLNSVFSIISICLIILSCFVITKNENVTKTDVAKEFGYVMVVQSLSLGVGIGFVMLLAVFYDGINYSLSWYTSSYLLFGLYFAPFYFCLCIGPVLYVEYRKKSNNKFGENPIPLGCIAQLFLHVQTIFWTFVLIVMTAMQIRSAFMVLIGVLFNIFSWSINNVMAYFTNFREKHCHYWLYAHLIGVVFPFLFYCSNALYMFNTFIPMQARNGPQLNPELVMAAFSIFFAILTGSFLCPLVILCRNRVSVAVSFIIIALIFFILMLTPLGFPYREKTNPQRYWIHHFERQFHTGESSAGAYLHPLDRHCNDYLDDFLGDYTKGDKECDDKIYCGFPFYHVRQSDSVSWGQWYRLTKPIYSTKTEIKFIEKKTTGNKTTTYKFQLFGSDRMSLYIVPEVGNKLINWSFSNSIPPSCPQSRSRNVYFLEFFSGHLNNDPFGFLLEFENLLPDTKNNLELAAVGHYMNHEHLKTAEFKEFLDKFPKWSVQSNWFSSYRSYMFK